MMEIRHLEQSKEIQLQVGFSNQSIFLGLDYSRLTLFVINSHLEVCTVIYEKELKRGKGAFQIAELYRGSRSTCYNLKNVSFYQL